MTANRSSGVRVTNDARYGFSRADVDRPTIGRAHIHAGQSPMRPARRPSGAVVSPGLDTPRQVTRKVASAMEFSEAGPASRFHETPSREIGWRFCVGVRCGGSERLPTAVS